MCTLFGCPAINRVLLLSVYVRTPRILTPALRGRCSSKKQRSTPSPRSRLGELLLSKTEIIHPWATAEHQRHPEVSELDALKDLLQRFLAQEQACRRILAFRDLGSLGERGVRSWALTEPGLDSLQGFQAAVACKMLQTYHKASENSADPLQTVSVVAVSSRLRCV